MLVGHHTDHNHDPFAIPKATTRRFRPQEIYFTASLLPLASDLPPAAPACHQRPLLVTSAEAIDRQMPLFRR
jgi:hypothetical protein